MLTFFTDTDCDFNLEDAKFYNIRLISMPYSMDGTSVVYPYEDFEYFDGHEFYQKLREGALPTTSAISEDRYEKYFEPEFQAGNDIIYVHFSANMTVTFDVMNKVVHRLQQKYPERKFYSVDTKGITTISYTICKELAERYKAGATAEELVAWANAEVDHFAFYFFANDLKFFKRSGRVSGLAATMGTLIGIRPIIYMSEEGKMINCGKEKGKMKAIGKLVSIVEELGENIKDYKIVVGHLDCYETACELFDAVRDRFGSDTQIEIKEVNPTAGSHCGPDGVGICFHAKHR